VFRGGVRGGAEPGLADRDELLLLGRVIEVLHVRRVVGVAEIVEQGVRLAVRVLLVVTGELDHQPAATGRQLGDRFAGELRGLAACGRIQLIEIHTATDGRLDMTRLQELVGDLTGRHTWACGPAGLLDALQQHWTEHGVADRLHTERFRAEILTTGDGGTVTFTKSGTTTEAAGDQTLLDTGEAAGVLMPSGCRMGVCFGCVVPLRRGAVRDVRTGDLTTAVEGDGVVIQTCISAAAGACDIDI